MEEFDDLKIPLKDVILATDSFATNNRIGCGGFGSVYKGELSRPEGLITVACKRLDRRFGQGNVEFSKEIVTLSKCKHENLVSLLHFCIEDDERILVYEYASRGSLDRYLSDPSLTWTQRLKICVGVAHALNYLHDPPTYTHQRIIHRDIKSSNILLDEEWNAKVSDFGLSKFGPANQPQTYLVSDAVGTLGYCDPLYWETGILSKESDVYSFGVVLHEVMCGTLCCEYCNGRLISILVPMWKKRFEEQRLDGIINHGLQKHMDPGSLNTFSTIAYQCLKTARKERPTMAKIVEQLNIALEQQEIFEDIVKRMNFERMRRIADFAVSSLSYVTQGQLLFLFMKGMLLDDGKTWFSVNKKGQHCELISSSKCVSASHTVFSAPGKLLHSRFQDLFKYRSTEDLRLTVVTQFLSPNVTYIINLVYKCDYPHNRDLRIPFKYKLEEMREYSTSCVAHVGEDGWQRTELFQFTSIKNEHYFDIHFLSELTGQEDRSYDIFSINIEGVEFCPVDFEKDENKVDNMQQPTDIDWGKRLPDEYAELIATTYSAYGISRKNAYFLLREGFLTNSEQWFSISKKSKKRLMLSARAILPEEKSGWNFLSRRKMSWVWKSLPGSRFEKVAESCDINHLAITFRIASHLLSHDTMYACYLVFKLPENASVFEGVVVTSFHIRGMKNLHTARHHIYLVTPPHTPIIELSPGQKPSRCRKIKGHPKLRKDGWMEIQMWEFLFSSQFELDSRYKSFWKDGFVIDGYFKSLDKWNFTGLIVKGIELRPAKVHFEPISM